MKYRREIDGLRAVAVVPVILFHAGFTIFSGGYIGVDVFFVISGYLITSILIDELEAERFSLARFYERRARRILPALFFVIFCCLPFAWAWMLPSQLKEFGQSLIAVSLFASNILFWKKIDYFAPDAENNPLLHTWSLAVEEQFYIVFPLLLWLLWRYGRIRVFWVIVGLCVISLGLADWGSRNKPGANFYLIVTRAWELGAGAICAFLLYARPIPKNAIFSILGLGLIVVSVFAYNDNTPFPSLYALAPVGGTVLIIIFAGPDTFVGRMLSLRALVGIGLISYSAYLWHQPLFAFARVRSLETPSQPLMMLLAALAIILAYLSWRFVERPFRERGATVAFTRRQIFALSGGAMTCVVGVATMVLVFDGNLGRYSQAQLADVEHARRGISHPQVKAGCSKGFHETETKPCILGAPEANKLIVMVGDSHARQWIDELDRMGRKNKWRVAVYSKAACAAPDVSYAYKKLGRRYTECEEWRQAVFEKIRESAPDLVIMTSSSVGYVRVDYSPVSLRDWQRGLKAAFDAAVPSETPRMWLFDNPRATNLDPLKCYIRNVLTPKQDVECRLLFSNAIDEKIREAERQIVTVDVGGTFLDLTRQYCGQEYCDILPNGQLLLVDSNHLSADTTARVAPLIENAIRESLTYSD